MAGWLLKTRDARRLAICRYRQFSARARRWSQTPPANSARAAAGASTLRHRCNRAARSACARTAPCSCPRARTYRPPESALAPIRSDRKSAPRSIPIPARRVSNRSPTSRRTATVHRARTPSPGQRSRRGAGTMRCSRQKTHSTKAALACGRPARSRRTIPQRAAATPRPFAAGSDSAGTSAKFPGPAYPLAPSAAALRSHGRVVERRDRARLRRSIRQPPAARN